MGAALESMQSTGKVVGIGDIDLVACRRQELVESLQVGFCFALKDVQQYRINTFIFVVVSFG